MLVVCWIATLRGCDSMVLDFKVPELPEAPKFDVDVSGVIPDDTSDLQASGMPPLPPTLQKETDQKDIYANSNSVGPQDFQSDISLIR